MPKTYSMDLREKIIDAWKRKVGTVVEIADLFGVSRRTVYNYIQRSRDSDDLSPLPNPGPPSRITTDCQDYITSLVLNNPSIRLIDLVKHVEDKFGIHMSEGWMCKNLKRIGFTRKKKTYVPTEQLDKALKKTG